jgi:hypothetical protein
VITLKNHTVINAIDCHGEWHSDNNILVLGYDEEGNEFEQIYADGADSWEDAVNKISKWADESGITVLELQAC